MRRFAICGLVLISLQPALGAEWSRAGWYRLEIFPALKILSAPFDSEKACSKTLPAVEDDVVRCVHLAKVGDEVDRAIAFFGAAIKENPRDATAMNYRALLYERQGDDRAALAEYANAMKANPDDYWAFVFRGKLYQKLGRRDEAIADYRVALAMNPGQEATINMLKAALKELGAA